MRKNLNHEKRSALILITVLLLGSSCTRETVIFSGFPALRITAPTPMSPAVVSDIVNALRKRLLLQADHILTRTYPDCDQYLAEVGWLIPTSPYAQQQLAAALKDKGIGTVRFTSYVREHPATLKPGMDILIQDIRRLMPSIRAAAPTGCQAAMPWPGHTFSHDTSSQ